MDVETLLLSPVLLHFIFLNVLITPLLQTTHVML